MSGANVLALEMLQLAVDVVPVPHSANIGVISGGTGDCTSHRCERVIRLTFGGYSIPINAGISREIDN